MVSRVCLFRSVLSLAQVVCVCLRLSIDQVLGLSIFCPLMFEARGVYDLSVGFGLLPKGGLIGHQQSITWEYLVLKT
jgi:hypothetical protein